MASDLGFKALNRLQQAAQAVTGGRLGWEVAGMPVLRLTTVGRHSGQSRTTLLTSPLQEGRTLVVIASRGGDDRHPAWYLNLSAQPRVVVSLAGAAPQVMRAETAAPDARAALWAQVVARHPRYGRYQQRTDREIPVVLLRPVDDGGAAGSGPHA